MLVEYPADLIMTTQIIAAKIVKKSPPHFLIHKLKSRNFHHLPLLLHVSIIIIFFSLIPFFFFIRVLLPTSLHENLYQNEVIRSDL